MCVKHILLISLSRKIWRAEIATISAPNKFYFILFVFHVVALKQITVECSLFPYNTCWFMILYYIANVICETFYFCWQLMSMHIDTFENRYVSSKYHAVNTFDWKLYKYLIFIPIIYFIQFIELDVFYWL